MGKGALILAMAGLVTTSVLLFNTEQTSMSTNQRQAERDEEVLAREIARSGYNAIRSKAVQKQNEGIYSVDHLVQEVNGGANSKVTGTYKAGTYEAWIEKVSAEAYMVHAVGHYGEAEHTMAGPKTEASGFTTQPTLTVITESTLMVTFLESMAGYCSAIYLQRIPPRGSGLATPNPELIFTPGNNRDNAFAEYNTVLQPGWRMNFKLAVDADMNCERRNQNVSINNSTFDYRRDALMAGVDELDEMQEGKYAIIQQNPNEAGVWRIAFEDLVFSDAQLADIKKYGYGDGSWRRRNGRYTYGGNGWGDLNASGYYELEDYGNMPDFSDQVIEVRLIDVETEVIAEN
jgi:hypothetical protein